METELLRVVPRGRVVELTDVLNQMSPEVLRGGDADVIDEIDALLDDLYRRKQLTIPGHRWLLGDPPTSIRGMHTALFAQGLLHREPSTGRWAWRDVTSHFAIR